MVTKLLLKQEVVNILNEAGSLEMYAHLMYQHIANNLQRLGFFNLQKYFLAESGEELEHYNKLADYTNDMGGMLEVPALKQVPVKVTSIMDALTNAYTLEVNFLKKYQRKSVGQYGDLISRFEKNTTDVFEFDEYIGTLLN